jgi:hypothetical protein
MTFQEILWDNLNKQGVRTITAAAKKAGISGEAARMYLNLNRIPKDRTITKIAKRLKIDPRILMVAAHRDRIKDFAEDHVLEPVASTFEKNRIWPLSQEQCDYLAKVMLPAEIQLIRKYRQISAEGQSYIRGCIDFFFVQHRQKPAAEAPDLLGTSENPAPAEIN